MSDNEWYKSTDGWGRPVYRSRPAGSGPGDLIVKVIFWGMIIIFLFGGG